MQVRDQGTSKALIPTANDRVLFLTNKYLDEAIYSSVLSRVVEHHGECEAVDVPGDMDAMVGT